MITSSALLHLKRPKLLRCWPLLYFGLLRNPTNRPPNDQWTKEISTLWSTVLCGSCCCFLSPRRRRKDLENVVLRLLSSGFVHHLRSLLLQFVFVPPGVRFISSLAQFYPASPLWFCLPVHRQLSFCLSDFFPSPEGQDSDAAVITSRID